jgi:hypothetical protein
VRTGRKRKPGRRYGSGDRTKAERQDDVRRVALEARMRVFGISGELAARDVMGSPLGRLLHWNIITEAQADSGFDFALTMRDYLTAIGGQRPSPSQASFLPALKGRGGPGMAGEIEARARAYMEALREVDICDPCSPSATSIVWDVCVCENDRLAGREAGLLRSGLNALGRAARRGSIAGRTAEGA